MRLGHTMALRLNPKGHHGALHRRIRELEAEVAKWRAEYVEADQRKTVLEAELADVYMRRVRPIERRAEIAEAALEAVRARTRGEV